MNDDEFDSCSSLSDSIAIATHDRDIEPHFEPASFLPYAPRLYWRLRKQVLAEVLAGVTVSFAQVPESVAFAFVAGVPPAASLHASWMVGLMMALFSAAPAAVCGASGVHAVVLAPALAEHGLGLLPYVVVMGGLWEILMAALRVAKFVRLIPMTVVHGFLNGLAIVIAVAQLHSFLAPNESVYVWESEAAGGWATLGLMLMLIVVTIVLVHAVPRLTKRVPGALIAIGVSVAIEQIVRAASGGAFKTPLVREVSTIGGGLPSFVWQQPVLPFEWGTIQKALLPSFVYCMVGVVELLLVVDVCNDQTGVANVNPNQSILANGIANVVAGLFSTTGASPMITLAMLLVRSGSNGRFRIAPAVVAICVLLVIVALDVVVGIMPMAALVGIMATIVVHTFNWRSALVVLCALLPQRVRALPVWRGHLSRKIDRTDALVVVVVTVLTLATNLLYGVLVGTALSALAYSWFSASHVSVDVTAELGVKRYSLRGPLFFGNALAIEKMFICTANDPASVEIDVAHATIYDFSAVEALNEVGAKFRKSGKRVRLVNMSPDSIAFLRKMDKLVHGFEYELGEPLMLTIVETRVF